ncbi:MAG: TonB-dependent receptor domain-containing protein [Oleiphilaceae bacterium]
MQVRGVTSHQTLINGIRMYNTTFSGSIVRGVDNLESVELLRGPAGLYYGSAQPSATPEDACYELAGLTRAQGVELRLSGQLMDGWVAQVGYSFTDTKYVDTDNEFAEGRSVKYTPRHSLALWNKFRVHRSASLGEFNLGLGMRAWSETHDSWTDTGTNWNPGYGLVDLGVFWDKDLSASKRLKVSLNISNLFDKQCRRL